ncbi:hypothetical protein [Pedobacter cryophilus]|uniref:3-keto-disaccharide hydrolase domain-containing protein n=1 Tax=Pedobacter cryophilus TaxID=2571271 RepID=A0A4U1C2E1_9SPHI|nr:hypothetical protein [Pedobacter cryophilus]TKB99197.1 hypothetical protein FA046_08820 [Pedobacter cryophilus]
MKRNFTITGVLLLLFTTVNAQKNYWTDAGVWEGKENYWNYSLLKKTGDAGDKFESKETAVTSISSTSTPGFLPYPSSGFAMVSSAAAAGGAFKIERKEDNATLILDASVAGGANKFTVYDIAKASAVSSMFFSMSFNENNPTNGSIVMALGSVRGNNIFKNAVTLTGADASGIFAGLRWEFSTNNSVFLSYRTLVDGSYGYKGINNSSFTKTGQHQVELYSNNATIEKKYIRGGQTYSIQPSTFNIWVNGKLLSNNTGSAFSSSGELAPESLINSFLFQGYHSKAPFPNALSVTLSNLQVNSIK